MLAPYPAQMHQAADFAGLLAWRHPKRQRLPICPASDALTSAHESGRSDSGAANVKPALQSRGGDGFSPSSRTRSLLVDDCSAASHFESRRGGRNTAETTYNKHLRNHFKANAQTSNSHFSRRANVHARTAFRADFNFERRFEDLLEQFALIDFRGRAHPQAFPAMQQHDSDRQIPRPGSARASRRSRCSGFLRPVAASVRANPLARRYPDAAWAHRATTRSAAAPARAPGLRVAFRRRKFRASSGRADVSRPLARERFRRSTMSFSLVSNRSALAVRDGVPCRTYSPARVGKQQRAFLLHHGDALGARARIEARSLKAFELHAPRKRFERSGNQVRAAWICRWRLAQGWPRFRARGPETRWHSSVNTGADVASRVVGVAGLLDVQTHGWHGRLARPVELRRGRVTVRAHGSLRRSR